MALAPETDNMDVESISLKNGGILSTVIALATGLTLAAVFIIPQTQQVLLLYTPQCLQSDPCKNLVGNEVMTLLGTTAASFVVKAFVLKIEQLTNQIFHKN
ncbi:MAG: hypothetical protein WCJ58_06620 [bacterium]